MKKPKPSMFDRALPCPLCGERLRQYGNKFGEVLAHKGSWRHKCFLRIVEILDERDLRRWNIRNPPVEEPKT